MNSVQNEYSRGALLDLVQDRLRGKTVLYVEDDNFCREQYTIFLHQLCNVVTAKDGEEGIKKFKEKNPDLILFDIGLPGIDGLTMLERIRKLPGGLYIPAIALTAYEGDIDLLKRFIYLGGRYYLTKPIFLWNLASALLDVLDSGSEDLDLDLDKEGIVTPEKK